MSKYVLEYLYQIMFLVVALGSRSKESSENKISKIIYFVREIMCSLDSFYDRIFRVFKIKLIMFMNVCLHS